MGFFDFFKKKSVINVTHQKPTQPIAQPIEKLTKEGELPSGWYSKHKHVFAHYEEQIVQMAVNLKQIRGLDRINHLENLIALYNEYKRFCYEKGECYKKYFSDMWEHCHNSRCKDFEYITPFLAELEALKNNKS